MQHSRLFRGISGVFEVRPPLFEIVFSKCAFMNRYMVCLNLVQFYATYTLSLIEVLPDVPVFLALSIRPETRPGAVQGVTTAPQDTLTPCMFIILFRTKR